ncbi:MAG TPA: nucleotidyl transferase AbiEii/AbiGii toxin family protein [Methylomirabilota bacterium]|nr:nucleotidyl transferase AbiEii/AbiGii toxin family protein [Methylomirabilota bacterium]
MSETRPAEFLDALRALCDGLHALGVPWMITGGVAVIAHGVPRYTADVDATVAASSEPLERVFEVLAGRRIVPRIDGALEFARERQVLLLRHEPSGVDLDVSLAWLPFEVEAIRRSETRDYAGVTIRIPRPDDLVIYKVVAARPRDYDDVERLLMLHGPSLDLRHVTTTVREFADALEDAGRIDTLERLLKQAGLRP